MKEQLVVCCPCCGNIERIPEKDTSSVRCKYCETGFVEVENYTPKEMLQDILQNQWAAKAKAVREILVKPSAQFNQEMWDKRVGEEAIDTYLEENNLPIRGETPVYIPRCPICGSPELIPSGIPHKGRVHRCTSCKAMF